MLQQEVVERMVAMPSGPEYGRLSVMLQYRFRLERLSPSRRSIPASAQSSFRGGAAFAAPFCRKLEAMDEAGFSAVVAKAFSKRRKTLRNALSG